MRFIKTTLLLLIVGLGVKAQHNITFTVNGLQPGDECIIAHYYADQNRIVDTSIVNPNGDVIFRGVEKLLNGVYIIVLPKKTFMEFIVPNDDQEFHITLDTSLSSLSKSAEGSIDNQVFFEFDKFAISPGKRKRELIEFFPTCETDACKEETRAKIKIVDAEVDAKRLELIETYASTFTSKLLKAVMVVKVPESLKGDTTGKQYDYFKAHYWDNIDLTDDGMLRTPVFKGKLEYYFGKLVVQQPDTLIPAIDELLTRIDKGGAMELYKYVIWWNTNHHEESKMMCMDKVLHHMAKSYYCAGKCFWADSTLVAKMCEHAGKIGPTRCGVVAPDMKLQDTTFARSYELHKISAPVTVVVFWDHECGHCKKEIPKLKLMYDSMKVLGVEVYSVYTQADWEGWKEYIRANDLNWLNVMDAFNEATYREDYNIISTPQVYMLDHNKVIRFKNPPADNVGRIAEIMLKEYNQTITAPKQ
ncbi:MAG: peroxiredoxin [Bacteroidia bacterium]|jgi:peroxiredoxin